MRHEFFFNGSVRLSVSPFSLSKPLEEAKKTAIVSLSASRRPLILSLSVGLLDGDRSVLSPGLLESKGKSIVQWLCSTATELSDGGSPRRPRSLLTVALLAGNGAL
ncbi:hypothetical protein F2Q70_00005696 [Brassica cretica]|uniref:Uncharacterized protein n=1 Tax=Brassica cretica TaxID=69181 RepID=A0A8S9ITH2_BRACR|nr:hypothetical protein F2Q70_00005696 [Brassica cretica]